MRDTDCVTFLQWALPRLDMRWAGFRKVRAQVCKRIGRRMSDLGIDSFASYRQRLETDAEEWRILDDCCHITISRFYRDKHVFKTLRDEVLPDIAARAKQEQREARCWSAGCASGEEPYTLKILWDLGVAGAFPGVAFSIIATDADEAVMRRAQQGCYARASLRELPQDMVEQAFHRDDSRFCIQPRHRKHLTFLLQDLRSQWPDGPFDLILCRNLAFTYFAPPLQEQVLERIVERLAPQGYLVIGAHERLPSPAPWLAPLPGTPQIFQLRDSNRAGIRETGVSARRAR